MHTVSRAVISLLILIAWALLFSFLPLFVASVPLRYQLSSDAEWYAAAMAATQVPSLLTDEHGFPLDIRPAGEVMIHKLLAEATHVIKIDLLQWSVALSFGALVLFVCGVYVLVRYALESSRPAFLVAFFSVIPVHALGGTTFGFQALGFLPRDLALAVAVYLLVLYVYALRQRSMSYLAGTFFVCGLLANGYVLLFVHLFTVLLLAEVIRTRKLVWIHVGYAVMFLLGAAPAIVEMIGKTSAWTPIDLEIMRLRHDYMMAFPLAQALSRYLRRFVVYASLMMILWYTVRRNGTDEEKQMLRPWFAIAGSSFILAIIGAYVESTTVYAKYQFSRVSVFFILAAMIICCVGLDVVCRKWGKRRRAVLAMTATSLIFLAQSNVPSVYRFLRDDYVNREQKQRFIAAAERLKSITSTQDVVLAPSEIERDMAASLRTYALRPIYVSYKDGGISLVDGQRGRKWLERYQTLQEVLSSSDAGPLLRLMRGAHIAYAFLPVNFPPAQDEAIRPYVVANAEGFLIVRAVSTP